MFIDNKYFRAYQRIVTCYQGVRLKRKDRYTERHHIVPRSLGGSDERSNIVRLPARVHFVVHCLLTKCTTGEDRKRMVFALWRMCISARPGMRVTSRLFQAIRIEAAEFGRVQMLGTRYGVGNSGMRGHTHTDEYKREQSVIRRERWKNEAYRQHMRDRRRSSPKVAARVEALAAAKRGVPHSPEHRARIRAALVNNPKVAANLAKVRAEHHTGVTRSPEARANMSAGQRRRWANRKAVA